VTGIEQGSEFADFLPEAEKLICDALRRSCDHQALEATLQAKLGIWLGWIVEHNVERSTTCELRLHHSETKVVRAIAAMRVAARGALVIGYEDTTGDTPA